MRTRGPNLNGTDQLVAEILMQILERRAAVARSGVIDTDTIEYLFNTVPFLVIATRAACLLQETSADREGGKNLVSDEDWNRFAQAVEAARHGLLTV
jgi:hypothetical protein